LRFSLSAANGPIGHRRRYRAKKRPARVQNPVQNTTAPGQPAFFRPSVGSRRSTKDGGGGWPAAATNEGLGTECRRYPTGAALGIAAMAVTRRPKMALLRRAARQRRDPSDLKRHWLARFCGPAAGGLLAAAGRTKNIPFGNGPRMVRMPKNAFAGVDVADR
jgi:hypothetical protein